MQNHSENPYMESLKGHFLIAMPSMADFNFSHTVTCLSEHTAKGALGMIINRIIPSLSARSIFEELKLEYSDRTESVPVYIGGPVHENEVFILHGPPFSWEGCLMITTSLAMSNTMDIIEAIAGDSPVPLALHGGTGLTEEVFRKCIQLGCAKVNISTQLKYAFIDGFVNYHNGSPAEYNPLKELASQYIAVKEAVVSNIRFFGSENRAS